MLKTSNQSFYLQSQANLKFLKLLLLLPYKEKPIKSSKLSWFYSKNNLNKKILYNNLKNKKNFTILKKTNSIIKYIFANNLKKQASQFQDNYVNSQNLINFIDFIRKL